MSKTLVARIAPGRNQYSNESNKIFWQAQNDGLNLEAGDNAIFISGGQLLFCEFERENDSSLEFKDVKEISCSNDELLRLHDFYPEANSRVKANFSAFIHEHYIKTTELIKNIEDKKFVRFFIVNSSFLSKTEISFKENDRVVLVSDDGKVETVRIFKNSKLIEFEVAEYLKVLGLSIQQLIEINKDVANKSDKKRSNNLERIIELSEKLNKNGIYEFSSFTTYHDTCFNKKLYNNQRKIGRVENTRKHLDKINSKNTIFYGPPGTGKTYITAERAVSICSPYIGNEIENQEKRQAIMEEYESLQESQQIAFVTFHQSYGYEEFIEGLRPVINKENKDNNISYEIRDGVFKALCVEARKNKDKNFVIIIDEINRGNISKIFGELITLLEEDKREGSPNKLSVKLPYSQEPFSIPNNVYVIGTMNTADRSLAQVDIALRRRFQFKEMMPDYSVLSEIFVSGIVIAEMLETINKRIEVLYDRDHTIGHAYFTELANISDDPQKLLKLGQIFEFKVIPLLQEYFFDDWQKIKLILGPSFVVETSIEDGLFRNDVEFDTDKKVYKFNFEALSDRTAYANIFIQKNQQDE